MILPSFSGINQKAWLYFHRISNGCIHGFDVYLAIEVENALVLYNENIYNPGQYRTYIIYGEEIDLISGRNVHK